MSRQPYFASYEALREYLGDTPAFYYHAVPPTQLDLWRLAAETLPLEHRVFTLCGFGVRRHEIDKASALTARRMGIHHMREAARAVPPPPPRTLRRYRRGHVMMAKRDCFGGKPKYYFVSRDGKRGRDFEFGACSVKDALRAHVWVEYLKRRYKRGARASDGGLWGVREFVMRMQQGRLLLCSPHMGTPWRRPALVAGEFVDSSEVRCAAGIHAYWPGRRHALQILGLNRTIARAQALVRGYGRTVQGDDGWRAERVVIEAVVVGYEQQAEALQSTYPDVPIHTIDCNERIRPWTDPFEKVLLDDAKRASLWGEEAAA